MDENLIKLPDGLPVPVDDGSCNHLLGKTVNSVEGKFVIMYFFPMMTKSEFNLPLGWNDIPGARGCTPQHMWINEHRGELSRYDSVAIGVSSQPVDSSQQLIWDKNLEFKEKLNIPTFAYDGKIFYKRVTIIVKDSKIIKVFYPIFPPDKHIFEILKWLKTQS